MTLEEVILKWTGVILRLNDKMQYFESIGSNTIVLLLKDQVSTISSMIDDLKQIQCNQTPGALKAKKCHADACSVGADRANDKTCRGCTLWY